MAIGAPGGVRCATSPRSRRRPASLRYGSSVNAAAITGAFTAKIRRYIGWNAPIPIAANASSAIHLRMRTMFEDATTGLWQNRRVPPQRKAEIAIVVAFLAAAFLFLAPGYVRPDSIAVFAYLRSAVIDG